MSNVVFFKPLSEVSSLTNLNRFITYCRESLSIYEEQGGFNSNKWIGNRNGRQIRMYFTKYNAVHIKGNQDYMNEPFLSFSKAYIRYMQSLNEVSSIYLKIIILRTVHDALIDIHEDADVLKVDGIVQSRVTELINSRYPEPDRLFRIGCQLAILYSFIRDHGLVPSLPYWSNVWKRPRSKAEGVDNESRIWQENRCPSLHHMLSLADCFSRATSVRDQYWSSVIALLMFAPSRAGELNHLTVNSLHEEEGRLGVRWYANKGYGPTIKWVPAVLETMVRIAFDRLRKIGQPAREAAHFSYTNPGVFYRHEYCITPEDFPEDEPLNALQFAHAMCFSPSEINKIKSNRCDHELISDWKFPWMKRDWIKKLSVNGVITYRVLADYVRDKYQDEFWPNGNNTNRPVWESLLLFREREFHCKHSVKSFSWQMPNIDLINDQLTPRARIIPVQTIFQRFGLKDENGGDIAITSHQIRVWLSTIAERGGMDSWKLAQWAGRARIDDNLHYDLRTRNEKENQINMLTEQYGSENLLASIKLNRPVAYQDLGINRIGVADVTEWGFCVHDYSMSPCTKGGECLICRDHVCVKGVPKTLLRIKQLETQLELQLQKARQSAEESVFGADRWETYLGWKLAHIRTQRQLLESDEMREGDVLWVPSDHDPGPVERALRTNGYNVSYPEEKTLPLSGDSLLPGDDDA